LFISIEGGEGVGKSTFIHGLKAAFEKRGRKVLITREPGGTPLADRIRKVFTDTPENESFTVEAELMLVSASRSQHVQHVILPALKSGQTVISDRFADSTRVYQGYLGKIDADFMESVISKTVYGRHPDVTFLLDCDVEISRERVIKRAQVEGEELSRYDAAGVKVHQDLRDGFLHYANKFSERFITLDASQTADDVLNNALVQLREKFGVELD
jgi:dTMP kinase